MLHTNTTLWIASLTTFFVAGCAAPPLAPGRHERVRASEPLHYVLIVPDDPAPSGGWPLLLFLHGAGERGDDLALVDVHGPTTQLDAFPELAEAVIVAPQCAAEDWWHPDELAALVDEVCALVRVDDARLYVTGLSMGGYGTWGLLARYPHRFAAAVPICGGGDITRLWTDLGVAPGFDLDGLRAAKDVPIWAFHGDADQVIPVAESRLLVAALEEVGGDVRLTEYAGVGHDAWTRTYADARVYAWMFGKARRDADAER